MLILSVIVLSFRTVIQIKSQPVQFFTDYWNWCQVINIILLTCVAKSMVDTTNEDEAVLNRNLFIASCAFLILQFTFFLKATFLPFARFVGGLMIIFYTLVPFFIVSGLLLLAFAYSFRVSGDHDDVCPSMLECYAWTLQGFFNGSDETSDMLDVLFGIIAIIILLNVLIAIVSEAWDTAKDKAIHLFWTYRLQFLSEARFLSKSYKKILSQGKRYKLGKYLDSISGIGFVDRTPWTKHPYSLVKNKNEYNDPSFYFHSDDAEEIKSSHSLQADLYWAKVDCGNQPTYSTWKRGLIVFTTIARWFIKFFFFLVLMLCGFFTAGWTWPLAARRYLLALGIAEEDKTQKKEEKSNKKLRV